MPHVLHLLLLDVKFETDFVLMQRPVNNDNSGAVGICININSFLLYFATLLNRNKTLKYILPEVKLFLYVLPDKNIYDSAKPWITVSPDVQC